MWLFLMMSATKIVSSQTIFIPGAIMKGLRPSVQDLQTYLQQATGNNFRIDTTSKPKAAAQNIVLVLLPQPVTLPVAFRANPYETARIQSNKNGTEIAAYDPLGLQHGIYTYLHLLGFRWFHAGEVWTHVPRLQSLVLNTDTTIGPSFEYRHIFAQTGLPRNPFLDKKKTVAKEWQDWARRNRLGSYYKLAGHTGNEFMWRNRVVLEQHPEYTALVNNQRTGVKTGAKFCISNPEFRKLFVQDMVQQLQVQIKKQPDEKRYVISVEPSDGGGHCTCEACKAMGSISTRVFFLANEVAERFVSIVDNAYVCLYAYNQHAAVPDVKLKPNVIVQVAPYQFQKADKPTVLIEKWKQVTQTLYIRDYYALPVTNNDRPLPVTKDETALAQKLAFWKQSGIVGVNMESSHSIPSAGPGLYFLAQYLWNNQTDSDALMKEYMDKCFGKSAAPMQQAVAALKGYAENPARARADAAAVLKKIQTESIDKQTRERIAVWKGYLVYLQLLENYQKATKAEQAQQSEALLTFAHQTFFYNIVHTAPLLNFMARNKAVAETINTRWQPKAGRAGPPATVEENYRNMKMLAPEEIENRFAQLYP